MEEAHRGAKPSGGRGRLYVVATPIGNLADITLRALDTLRAVDVVLAEDTRTTGQLLSQHGVRARLKALHEHNEAAAASAVVAMLRAGEQVALVSDAGTPAISDPGARLVRAVREAGFHVVPIPGPSALAAALSVSGSEGPFAFLGFLPAKSGARVAELERWRDFPHALVLYEAPHRVRETLADLARVLGSEREVLIARELTKMFEQIHACALGEAEAWIAADANRERGEFVLVVSGPSAARDREAAEGDRVLSILLKELPVRQAAKLAAAITGARKNELYERALELRKKFNAEDAEDAEGRREGS
ncbi:MAG: 16S rRNA (cytidine(1402)-2'-O)-methyltransferase [Burkholderiales bacterium]|nr:16S rRNA (cytidine(1402)-2'-O)-methyltransferase [Burkholderiales bacterium]